MKWKKYYQVAKSSTKEAAAYKVTVVSGFFSSLLLLVLYFSIWSAIAQVGELEGGLAQVLSYLVIGQVVHRASSVQTENFIGRKIRKGTITNEFKRPISLRSYTYFHEAGWKVVGSLTAALPLLIVGMIFFPVRVPSASQLLLFGVSLFMAFNLVFSLSYTVSLLVFWTKVEWSLRMMRNMITSFFSGRMFPLYLLPGPIAGFFNILPFKAMVDTPVRIFMGLSTGTEAIKLIGIQFIWIIILTGLSHFVYSKARSKLTVQGG